MADKNISQFTEETTRENDQIIYLGKANAGGYLDRFMSMANLILGLFNKSTDTTDAITEGAAKFTTEADILRLANTSGTNTGDQDLSGLIAKNVGATYTTNTLTTVTQAEYDALTPDATTVYFIV